MNIKEWNSEEIKNLRRKLHLTQMQLALKLGYNTYTPIYYWESGRSKPNKRMRLLLTMIEKGNNLITNQKGE